MVVSAIPKLSQLDVYFFAPSAMKVILSAKDLLHSTVKPALGENWPTQLSDLVPRYRGSLDLVIHEAEETSEAARASARLMANVREWRLVGEDYARGAPGDRKEVLLKAIGYGEGSPVSAKEMSELLFTIKNRLEVHGPELVAMGMPQRLIGLPARVLAKLEGGSADVGKEKTEDDRARAEARRLHGELTRSLTLFARAAGTISRQARLLAQDDEATEREKAAYLKEAKEADTLAVALDKALGEARVASRERAAEGSLPQDVAEAPVAEDEPVQPAA